MSRSKPNVLLSYTDPKTYKAEQILEATGVYAVYYDSKPFNYRSLHTLIDKQDKYKKNIFVHSAPAFNLAQKLNRIFKTDKFEVYELYSGNKIKEKNKFDFED